MVERIAGAPRRGAGASRRGVFLVYRHSARGRYRARSGEIHLIKWPFRREDELTRTADPLLAYSPSQDIWGHVGTRVA